MTTVRHLLDRKDRTVYSVEPDDPVLEAIQLMAERYIGAVPVMRGDELLGIVSERDCARKVVLPGLSASETPAWQIMSSPVYTVSPEQTLNDCMHMVTERRIRHLPVVEKGKVIGVVSIGDLVKAVIEEQQRTIEQLEDYIHR